MFDSKFLRRIEANPSPDLARRRDLYDFQLITDLEPEAWHSLVLPPDVSSTVNFNREHERWVKAYSGKITTLDPEFLFRSLVPPIRCVNKTIYNFCLINRIRYELDYPLVTTTEDEWIMWVIYLQDPAFKSKLDNLVLGKFENG